MQVIEETPDRLVIESRPWVLGGVLILGILILLALAMALWSESAWLTLGFGLAALLLCVCFAVFVRRLLVIFDRSAGMLVIRARSLSGQTERTLSLGDILRAEVETTRSSSTSTNGSRSTSVTHRPVLVTRSGPVPLTQIASSGDGAAVIVAAMNRWLSAPAS